MAKKTIQFNRFVRVWYEDVGSQDGLVVDVNDDGTYGVYFPDGCVIDKNVESEQILTVGPRIIYPRF